MVAEDCCIWAHVEDVRCSVNPTTCLYGDWVYVVLTGKGKVEAKSDREGTCAPIPGLFLFIDDRKGTLKLDSAVEGVRHTQHRSSVAPHDMRMHGFRCELAA